MMMVHGSVYLLTGAGYYSPTAVNSNGDQNASDKETAFGGADEAVPSFMSLGGGETLKFYVLSVNNSIDVTLGIVCF